MFAIPFIWFLIFSFGPMYGVLLAFKKYKIRLGILGSPWADNFGMENFIRFFNSYNFWQCLGNTFALSIYSIAVGMPMVVIFALMLNYARRERFRKTVQLTAYAPYFISQIIMVGILSLIFHPRTGALGQVIYQLTGVNILADAGTFSTLYVFSSVWQNSVAAAALSDGTVHLGIKLHSSYPLVGVLLSLFGLGLPVRGGFPDRVDVHFFVTGDGLVGFGQLEFGGLLGFFCGGEVSPGHKALVELRIDLLVDILSPTVTEDVLQPFDHGVFPSCISFWV